MSSATADGLRTANRSAPTSALRFGGATSALGALGVVVTSVLYIAAPGVAAGPVQPLDVDATMAGVRQGADALRAAGLVGVVSDLVWASGALAVAHAAGKRGRALSVAGWAALFVSILLFTVVDGMTATVLPPLAAAGNAAGFEGIRLLWNMLFLVGTLAFAAATLAILVDDLVSPPPVFGRAVTVVLLVVAALGGAGALGGLLGLSAARLVGASIGLGSLLYVRLSLQLAGSARSASP